MAIQSVKYFHEIPGVGTGNIIWRGSWPMRGGKFPADHPAAPGLGSASATMEFGTSENLAAFRERGYWASCFPEGDGITMLVKAGQDAAQVAKDITEVFGWTVDVERA